MCRINCLNCFDFLKMFILEPQRPAMDRDAEEPIEATSESSPLVQQPAGSQSPVPSSTTVTDPSSNQESAGRYI